MAAHRFLFGKYRYTPSIQTLARAGFTKEEVRRVFVRLGCEDVADNTIKTQFTDYKNPKYRKEDVPFSEDEWNQLEKARNGVPSGIGATETVVNDLDALLAVKEFANGVGGVQRLKNLCDVILRLQ